MTKCYLLRISTWESNAQWDAPAIRTVDKSLRSSLRHAGNIFPLSLERARIVPSHPSKAKLLISIQSRPAWWSLGKKNGFIRGCQGTNLVPCWRQSVCDRVCAGTGSRRKGQHSLTAPFCLLGGLAGVQPGDIRAVLLFSEEKQSSAHAQPHSARLRGRNAVLSVRCGQQTCCRVCVHPTRTRVTLRPLEGSLGYFLVLQQRVFLNFGREEWFSMDRHRQLPVVTIPKADRYETARDQINPIVTLAGHRAQRNMPSLSVYSYIVYTCL